MSEMLSGLRKPSAERCMTREVKRLLPKEMKFQRNTRKGIGHNGKTGILKYCYHR